MMEEINRRKTFMTQHVSKYIWYDMMTPDVKSATAFYESVVGWKITDAGMPDRAYSILNAQDVMVGGLMQTPKGMEKMQVPPRWHGHIYVADVDVYAKRVVAAGGVIDREPSDIPGIGRFAVVSDPQGASFILFKPNSTDMPKPIAPDTAGHVGWRELHTTDAAAAWTFYEGLFGWSKSREFDMGQLGTYHVFATGAEDAGGMMNRMPDTPKSHWLYYFNVDSIDAAMARVKKAKGKIIMGPHQVPTGHWIVQAIDPTGATFALLSRTP
jgi:predicted enzyme related to lactoylglutathione lyase